jgi:hypothetical protein
MNRYSSSLDILKTLRKKGMMQPDASLVRAFPRAGFRVDYIDSKTLEELNEIYNNWRKTEAEDRKHLRKIKKMMTTPIKKRRSDFYTKRNVDKTEGMVYKKPPNMEMTTDMTNELDAQRRLNKQIVNENMLPTRAYSSTVSDRKMRALARENSSSSTKWDENREELANALLYMNTKHESETEEDDIDVSSVASEGTLLDSDMDYGIDDNETDKPIEPIEPVPKRSRISRGALQGQDSLHYLPINKGGSTKKKDKKKRSSKKRSSKITRKKTKKRTKKRTK